MKILLTGSNGFLGKVMLQTLSIKNEVYTLNRNSSDYNVDLSRDDCFFDQKFDLVIHAAGMAHSIPLSEEEISMYFEINVNGTENLLYALSGSSLPKQFVFISTVAVYGEFNGSLINEQSQLKAIDPYGRSKIQAEQRVVQWCSKNDVIMTIFRLPLVVGLDPPGNLGKMINGLRKGFYFNVAGGSAKKSMVLASDVAKFVLKASEVGGIYNLTDRYHPSFFELSNNLSNQLGRSKPKNLPFWFANFLAKCGDILGSRAPLNSEKLIKITSTLTFDDSKAFEVFGWRPNPVLMGFWISEKKL
jgi:nucleoside-diphosphate-sugar epimerase